jgi:hypothetical protein
LQLLCLRFGSRSHPDRAWFATRDLSSLCCSNRLGFPPHSSSSTSRTSTYSPRPNPVSKLIPFQISKSPSGLCPKRVPSNLSTRPSANVTTYFRNRGIYHSRFCVIIDTSPPHSKPSRPFLNRATARFTVFAFWFTLSSRQSAFCLARRGTFLRFFVCLVRAGLRPACLASSSSLP